MAPHEVRRNTDAGWGDQGDAAGSAAITQARLVTLAIHDPLQSRKLVDGALRDQRETTGDFRLPVIRSLAAR